MMKNESLDTKVEILKQDLIDLEQKTGIYQTFNKFEQISLKAGEETIELIAKQMIPDSILIVRIAGSYGNSTIYPHPSGLLTVKKSIDNGRISFSFERSGMYCVGFYDAFNTPIWSGWNNLIDIKSDGKVNLTIEGSTVKGTNTYSTQSAKYFRDNNLVTVYGTINMTKLDPLSTGIVTIAGFPFETDAPWLQGFNLGSFSGIVAPENFSSYTCRMVEKGFRIYVYSTAGYLEGLDIATALTNTSQIEFCVTYPIKRI